MHDSDKFTCVFKDSKEKEICANRLDEQYEEHPEGKWSNNCVMTCILERKKKKKEKDLLPWWVKWSFRQYCRQRNLFLAEFLMTWKQNSLHLDTRSVWPQNPGSLCCAHTALLVNSSSTVKKWSPCQSHFTIWQFGSQSSLRIFKRDSLRRKLIQKFSSIHLCTKLIPVDNGDSDWIGDCSDSSTPCLRWGYQGARLNIVHSKIPKPSITLIYQLVIYLPQCTDLLVLHRVICLCQTCKRQKHYFSQ